MNLVEYIAMADFCPTCSMELFGEDYGDIRGYTALCEGCASWVAVDKDGNVTKRVPFEDFSPDEA